jgi:hypothetical protein
MWGQPPSAVQRPSRIGPLDATGKTQGQHNRGDAPATHLGPCVRVSPAAAFSKLSNFSGSLRYRLISARIAEKL